MFALPQLHMPAEQMAVNESAETMPSHLNAEAPAVVWDLRARFLAAGMHLGASMVMAGAVLALVYSGWYVDPLGSISGIGEILIVLLAVDVALGPVLTFAVFDRRKKSLRFDLACIAFVQLAALLYGLHSVERGRPHHLVFVKDRFEVVSHADLTSEDRAAAAGNPAAEAAWFGPRIVAAEMPAAPEETRALMLEAALGGRDVQHFPKLYRDYATQASLAAQKAGSLDELRAINPNGDPVLDDAVARSGLARSGVRYLPIKGHRGDATMLIDGSSGAIVGMVRLAPWRE
jgi:hypothetical protein